MDLKSSRLAAFYILFWDNFGFALVFPIFPVLFLNPELGFLPSVLSEGARNIFLGALLAAYPLAQFFGAPFFGDIADLLGRKKALFWTITGTILGYCLTAIALHTHLFALLIFSRLATGFFAGNLSICMAIIADLSPQKKQRGKMLSLVATFLGLSWIAAILLGTYFTHIAPSLPFWIIALLTFTNLFVLFQFYRETSTPSHSSRRPAFLKGIHHIIHIFDRKQLRVLFLTLFFWLLGFFISLQWAAPVILEKYSITQDKILWFFLLMGAAWALSSGFLNRWLIEHSSIWKSTLWSLFFLSLFFFFSAVSDFYFYFTACYVIATIFAAIGWANSMNLISLASSEGGQATSLGVGQSMSALAQVLGPLLGGLLAGLSIELVFFGCAFFVLIAFLLLLVYVIRRKTHCSKTSS